MRGLTLCCAVLLASQPLAGQEPILRLGAEPGAELHGVRIDGAAVYPAQGLEQLGFRIASSPAGTLAVLGADTIRFWATSPFFRAGTRVHQLAFPARHVGGVAHLPEQFFIQWLPATYPSRFEFRGGTLLTRQQTPAQAVPRSGAAPASMPPAVTPTAAPKPIGAHAAASRAAAARVVVIDPGHGGRDPGKIGPNGLREKDVTLMIAQRLAAVLTERGYEVHLTRSTDTYVSLPDRPKLANKWKGDRPVAVFLSIHANSAPTAGPRGFETFFLSEARTEDERRVAEMENEAIQFDEQPHAVTDNGLDRILSTLRNDFLMRASHDLAAVMQERMAGFHPGPNRGVKRAGFYVLVGTIMPAVLIETAFISNREEATLLGTQAFQQKIAWGIADGVDEFFSRNEHLWVQEP